MSNCEGMSLQMSSVTFVAEDNSILNNTNRLKVIYNKIVHANQEQLKGQDSKKIYKILI